MVLTPATTPNSHKEGSPRQGPTRKPGCGQHCRCPCGAPTSWPATPATGSGSGDQAYQPPSCFSTFWMMALFVNVSSSSLCAL